MRRVTRTARRMRGRLIDSLRGRPEHRVRQPANHTQLVHDAHRLLTRQRARLEAGSQPLERRPRGRECVEHQRQSINEV